MSVSGIESHWGASAVDISKWDLPALKASYLVANGPSVGRVCEVGSGDGKLLRTLHRARPELELFGCDVRAPRKPPEVYSFRLIEKERLPFDDSSLEGAIVFDVLEHVPDPSRTLSEVARVLKPGGTFVAFVPIEGQAVSWYSVYRRLFGDDTYIETKEHIQSFSRDGLRALVERDFTVVNMSYAYHAFGQWMDASFFAAAKLKSVRKFWWNDNVYYNDTPRDSNPSLVSRALNGLLRLGNAAAFAESRLLENVPFSSAGVLFVARVRK